MSYFMKGYAEFEDGVIVQTHPAPVGTNLVYANSDGSHHMTPILLWGVMTDASIVPITFSGPWDGVSNNNSFVLHPDGTCSAFEESWPSIEEAIADRKKQA